MRLNVIFDYAIVKDFVSLEVALGEKFQIECEEFQDGTQWFFNNYPVLNIIPDNNRASIEALNEGNCKILFMKGNTVVHSLEITVTQRIFLNPQTVSVELK